MDWSQRVSERTTKRSSGRPERGAGLVEYGILLLLILVVCLVAMGTLGTTITGFYDTVTAQF